jgi:hypothetical protein
MTFDARTLKNPCTTTNHGWFNLIKMSTLAERMFALTKGMGHERHMVFLTKGSKCNKMTHIYLVWGVVGKDLKKILCNFIIIWHKGLGWS